MEGRIGVGSCPEAIQIEGELAMVLDGEEDELASPVEIQKEVILHHEFSEIVFLPQQALEPPDESVCLQGPGRVGVELASGTRKPAERRNNVVEEPIEKPVEGSLTLGLKE